MADAKGTAGENAELISESARESDPVTSGGDEVSELKRLLLAHPAIFDQHPELLEKLQLRHASGGAVSLIERQVARLREVNERLRGQLDSLISTASENESRIEKLMQLAAGLLETGTAQALLETLGRHLESDFSVSRWALYHEESEVLGSVHLPQVQGVPASGELRGALENALRTGRIECGAMDEKLAAILFDETAAAGSLAIVPMLKQQSRSVLVLGSADADKFRPESGSVVLEMLAALVAAGLRRFAAGSVPGDG